MKLESIVTSLEVSERLEQAGFERPTLFHWTIMRTVVNDTEYKLRFGDKWKHEREYPAYTFEQLWHVLTDVRPSEGKWRVELDSQYAQLTVENYDTNKCGEDDIYYSTFEYANSIDPLADTIAEVLLGCIENGLVILKENQDEKR